MKKKRTREERERILLVILIVAFIVLEWLLMPPQLLWDEAAFLGNARDVFGVSAYTEDFRNPLFSQAVAIAWLFTGENVIVARSLSTLAGAISILLVYLIARKHTRYALLLAALFATNAQLILWSNVAYAEALTCMLVLLSIWAYEKTQNTWWVFLSGVAGALAFQTRFANALVVMVCAAYLLYARREDILPYGAGVLIASVPWLIRNQILYGNPLWDLLEQGGVIAQYTASQPVLPFLGLLFVLNGALLISIGIGVVQGTRPSDKMQYAWIGSLLLLLALHLFAVRLKLPRYSLAILPFLVVIAAYQIARAPRKRTITHILVALLIISSVFSIVSAYETRNDPALCPDLFKQTPQVLKQIISEDAVIQPRVISNIWPYIGYELNLPVNSIYSADWLEYRELHNIEYVVYSTHHGLIVEGKTIEDWQALGYIRHEETITRSCGKVSLWRVIRSPQQVAREHNLAVGS